MKYLRDTKGKSITPDLQHVWTTATCCGHMLDPENPMTLDEIVKAHEDYGREFPDEAFYWTPERIERGLQELIRVGLAKEVHE